MEDWDQDKLEDVVKQKHGAEKPSNKTEIICKYFLDAVEAKLYGWFVLSNLSQTASVPFGAHPVFSRDKSFQRAEECSQAATSHRFWQCPNGKECKYRHALPPGYILKSQMKVWPLADQRSSSWKHFRLVSGSLQSPGRIMDASMSHHGGGFWKSASPTAVTGRASGCRS